MVLSGQISGSPKGDVTVVVDRFYVSLYRFALCLTTSHRDAADLVRQTFLTFSRQRHQIHDYSKIERWLFTALHQYYLIRIRSRRNRPKAELALEVHDPAMSNPERPGFPWECELPAALARVNETCRPALSLFYLGKFSVREIAHILQVPIDTVMSRLSQGKVQLRLIQKPS